MLARNSLLARSAFSLPSLATARFLSPSLRAVMSRDHPKIPITLPLALRHGILVVETHVSCPSGQVSFSSTPIIGWPVAMIFCSSANAASACSPAKMSMIGFSDDFRLIFETGPRKHCAICRQKTAFAIFKPNVVRKVVHQRGQAKSLAGERGCDVRLVRDVRAKVGSAGSLECRRHVSNACRSAGHQL